jgi:hypothetical protein
VATELTSKVRPRFKAVLIKGASCFGVRGLRATQAAQNPEKHPFKIMLKKSAEV